MRIQCPNCKFYDEKRKKWHIHLAEMTEWRPRRGLDPFLREFKCSNCDETTHQSLTTHQLELEKIGYL